MPFRGVFGEPGFQNFFDMPFPGHLYVQPNIV